MWCWTPSVIWKSPSVLPRAYLDGVSYLASQDTVGTTGYVAGIAYQGGRWWFWPVSLVIKWPAASLLLLVAGAAVAAFGWRRLPAGVPSRLAGAVVLPAVLLTAFTLTMPRDVGLRYLLPAMALWAVLAGALVPAVTALRPRPRHLVQASVAGLLTLALLATIWSFPDSLAWTTRPFRPAYRAVTDSNIDWGQGLYALSAWSERHHPWIVYFGPRGITPAAIPGARALPSSAPAGISGWVAVSVTASTAPTAPRWPGSGGGARSACSTARSCSTASGSRRCPLHPSRSSRPRCAPARGARCGKGPPPGAELTS